MRSTLMTFACCAVASAALTPMAKAGPVEEVIQLAANPARPDDIVLRYQYSGDGLIYSRDGGQTFALVCSASVKLPGEPADNNLGPMALAGDGKLLMGVFGGMWLDDGKGCSWSREPTVEGKWISDITLHPSDPQIAYAITSNGGKENGVVRRNADGSFTELGVKKDQLLTRIRIAALPDGGVRIYESAVNGQIEKETDGGITYAPSFALRMSDDDGATWTEFEIGEVDGQLRLEAVDPMNPDRIVLSVGRDRETGSPTPIPDSILLTENLGEDMTEWMTVTEFGGIAFGEDGEVWIADRGDTMADPPKGIWHATSVGEEPVLLTSEFGASCVHYANGELFACQRFGFGRVDKESGEYTAAMRLPMLEKLNECEDIDMGATCRQQLCMGYCGLGHFPSAPMCIATYDSNEEVGCQSPSSVVDAGVSGAGATSGSGGSSGAAAGEGAGGAGGTSDDSTTMDAGSTPPSEDGSDSGCSVARHQSARHWTFAAWAIAAAAFAFRTRRIRFERAATRGPGQESSVDEQRGW